MPSVFSLGDLSSTGTVSTADLTLMLSHIGNESGHVITDSDKLNRMNIDGTSGVSNDDVTELMDHLTRKNDLFKTHTKFLNSSGETLELINHGDLTANPLTDVTTLDSQLSDTSPVETLLLGTGITLPDLTQSTTPKKFTLISCPRKFLSPTEGTRGEGGTAEGRAGEGAAMSRHGYKIEPVIPGLQRFSFGYPLSFYDDIPQ